ncbi:MAG: hypothetical protein LDL31_11370, partial [Prosthecobacter sp.]|nr:hypothetical protein [Prosthecobacter sp.]
AQARVAPHHEHLLRYLLETDSVRVIKDCLEDCVFVTSASVRQMMHEGNPAWRSYVPEIVMQRGPWAQEAA